MKIAVGLSGGVDSSVAAWLLKQQGHEVVGIMMRIWDGSESASVGRHACYGPGEEEEVRLAEEFCRHIGIPFHVFDCAREYRETVLAYFKDEYGAGRTPNPCVKCNHAMKFGLLPAKARRSGLEFDFFATGHYARIDHGPPPLLLKGSDPRKDQSYFLYRLTRQQLAETLFPLGELAKTEVRKIASEQEFPTAAVPESQDFYCGDYAELLESAAGNGAIVDQAGKVLGQHQGTWRYTPGQRKGLGVASTAPLYVVEINAAENTVVVGRKGDAFSSSFLVKDINWLAPEPLNTARTASVKVRAASEDTGATLESADGGKIRVMPDSPQIAAPGQSAVFYDGDVVIGGGVIDSVAWPKQCATT